MRHLIKHETEEPVTDKAELLMLYAARIQLVENVIKPALAEGKIVLGDLTICLRRPIKVVGVSFDQNADGEFKEYGVR